MSRAYTVEVTSTGRRWGRWWWEVSGPLANQDDDPMFTFTLASGFTRTRERAERAARRAVDRAGSERRTYLGRETHRFDVQGGAG